LGYIYATPNQKSYTLEEYLELEEQSESKHEYRDGEIISITGATTNHHKIVANLEEYLELEEQSESKHEYRDGEIISITGATTNHHKIVANFYAHLKFGLRKKNIDF
jgi:Uma2 family endonuclease